MPRTSLIVAAVLITAAVASIVRGSAPRAGTTRDLRNRGWDAPGNRGEDQDVQPATGSLDR